MTPGDLSLLARPWPDVRESVDPGNYYCAHLLWVGARAARARAETAHDERGDPLFGFLHVPPDAWTLRAEADEDGGRVGRHDATCALVGLALRGYADAAGERPLRTLVTGFGSFRDVVDNPTGAFVEDPAALARALAIGFPDEHVSEVRVGPERARAFVAGERLVLTAVKLPVDDRSLASDGDGALRTWLARSRAAAWIGLGVSRSANYRVEVRPHDGGLAGQDDEAPRHESGLPEERSGPQNRALARAIERGAQAVESQAAPLASA